MNREEKHKLALKINEFSRQLDAMSRQLEGLAHSLDNKVGPRYQRPEGDKRFDGFDDKDVVMSR